MQYLLVYCISLRYITMYYVRPNLCTTVLSVVNIVVNIVVNKALFRVGPDRAISLGILHHPVLYNRLLCNT